MARSTTMRYCRCEFHGPRYLSRSAQITLPIEFGYLDTAQRNESAARLRKLYRDYAFVRCYSIPTPPTWRS
jgi:hypothetical protein